MSGHQIFDTKDVKVLILTILETWLSTTGYCKHCYVEQDEGERQDPYCVVLMAKSMWTGFKLGE